MRLFGLLHRLHDGSEVVETENHPIAEAIKPKIADSRELFTEDNQTWDEIASQIKRQVKTLAPVFREAFFADQELQLASAIFARLICDHVNSTDVEPDIKDMSGYRALATQAAGVFHGRIGIATVTVPSAAVKPVNGTKVDAPVADSQIQADPLGKITFQLIADNKRHTYGVDPGQEFGTFLSQLATQEKTPDLIAAVEEPAGYCLIRGDSAQKLQLPAFDATFGDLHSVLAGHVWSLTKNAA